MSDYNQKFSSIADKSSEVLKALMTEAQASILDTWAQVEAEALDAETQPKLKLGFSITLDLSADSITHALSWSVRRKVEAACSIPDPNQTELGMEVAE